MKKNAMLKIAAILMVAVLLTTCAISSTFAKYVTTGDIKSDTANVAKWGVKVDTKAISDLFVKTYDKDSNDEVIGVATDVVAPGTTNYVTLTSSVTGKPEVAVEVTTEATVDIANWTSDGTAYYCPLVFKVGATEATATEIKGLDYSDADSFEQAIVDKIELAKKQYAAGQDLSAATEIDLYISWTWAIDGATGAKGNQTNANDTYLGDLADAGVTVPSVTITLQQIVTQIDTYTAAPAQGN